MDILDFCDTVYMTKQSPISGKTSDKPHSHEEQYVPSKKRGVYTFFNRILRLIWWLFVAFIVSQVVLVIIKSSASKPHERMCFDAAGCFEYCATFSGARCMAPEHKDTARSSDAWRLLLTGKRTLLEIYNENQGYCSCTYQTGNTFQTETFYKFYADPPSDY